MLVVGGEQWTGQYLILFTIIICSTQNIAYMHLNVKMSLNRIGSMGSVIISFNQTIILHRAMDFIESIVNCNTPQSRDNSYFMKWIKDFSPIYF